MFLSSCASLYYDAYCSWYFGIPTCHVTIAIALANQEARSKGGNFESKDRADMWTSYCPLVIHFLPAGDSFLPASMGTAFESLVFVQHRSHPRPSRFPRRAGFAGTVLILGQECVLPETDGLEPRSVACPPARRGSTDTLPRARSYT